MRLNNTFGFRLGVNKVFDDELTGLKPIVFNPGLRINIGDFNFDLFLNKDWPFLDNEKVLIGAGLDFNFDKF